jgi:hypothetical protein
MHTNGPLLMHRALGMLLVSRGPIKWGNAISASVQVKEPERPHSLAHPVVSRRPEVLTG